MNHDRLELFRGAHIRPTSSAVEITKAVIAELEALLGVFEDRRDDGNAGVAGEHQCDLHERLEELARAVQERASPGASITCVTSTRP